MTMEQTNKTMEQKVEDVFNKMLNIHPEYQEEINVLKRAYDYPFEHFCNREAEYRLNNDFDIDESIKDYEEIKDLIAHDLMDADNYPDAEVADDIIRDVLNEHAFRMVKATSEEMESTSLINIEKSDPDVLTRRIMKDIGLNTLDAYDMIFESLSSGKFSEYSVYCHLLEEIRAKFDKNQDEPNNWHEVKNSSNCPFVKKLWIRNSITDKYPTVYIKQKLVNEYKVYAALINYRKMPYTEGTIEDEYFKKLLEEETENKSCFHVATFHKLDGAIRKAKDLMESL